MNETETVSLNNQVLTDWTSFNGTCFRSGHNHCGD